MGDQGTEPTYAYRSTENPWYWKNRPPFAGYWQQDVDYKISATLDDSANTITGKETLTYYNNSPDTLYYVYFHLYQESFQPGSYLDDLYHANHIKPTYGAYESEGLDEEVDSVTVIAINGKSTHASTQITRDYSVIRVDLQQPILPDANITFYIPFTTYFDIGSVRRRMQVYTSYGYNHYNCVHWYPRICVYDRKFGWATDQHLGREFYGDFGTFDVSLTLPSNYILDATGVLQNAHDVLPESLREKLDIRNFRNKPWEEKPSVVIPWVKGETKTWKFHAVNVHDFAFTADPTYRIGEVMAVVNGRNVVCRALVQEPHAIGWQNAADYTRSIIETFSRDFGEYIYPHMTVADARDGMEYPMLTLDGGFDPSYRSLLTHEVGHNWFFGMLGNNETYRAALDEGFTQFLTAWGYASINGPTEIHYHEKGYAGKFRETQNVRYVEDYFGYLMDAERPSDATLNTHSDMFNSAIGHGGGYSQVYFKTATMLYNLQYVLGDDLFQKAMQHYVSQWRLCHPYLDDFRNSIINYTQVDLNWFFDEWLETTKTIDYSISDVHYDGPVDHEGQKLYTYTLSFKRKGRMQMPLDVAVVLDNGDTVKYYIPNTWFNKYDAANQTENDGMESRINGNYFSRVITLPKWYGWDLLNDTYSADITLTDRIRQVIIDPSDRLADINKLDNAWKTPVKLHFDSKISNYPDWNHYEMYWRPDIWYNTFDGIKLGLHFSGGYMRYRSNFELSAWYNTALLQGGFYNTELNGAVNETVSFALHYQTAVDRLLPNMDFDFGLKHLDGAWDMQTGFTKTAGRYAMNNTLYIKAHYLLPVNQYYFLYPDAFGDMLNASVQAGIDHRYHYFSGNGNLHISLQGTAPFSHYDYGYFQVENINHTRFGKLDLDTRLFLRAGYGKHPAPESELYLAGASPEELLDNKFTRSRGWVPDDWIGFGEDENHFQEGGGLNIRGYAGYLLPETDRNGLIIPAYRGTSGASANAELRFNRLFHFKLIKALNMQPYLFGDGGSLVYQDSLGNSYASSFRMDAGIGATFSWHWWGPLETVPPFTLRFDVPLFLNRPSYLDGQYVGFRYVVGISQSF